ncbi:hypothetical protein QL093DRAFT_2293898 [Fusarium oxysporum]|jgi:hypothetical protein|nr:hypothetical protein QL093DRAFT_2293898 [Fusarium oxysporum]
MIPCYAFVGNLERDAGFCPECGLLKQNTMLELLHQDLMPEDYVLRITHFSWHAKFAHLDPPSRGGAYETLVKG